MDTREDRGGDRRTALRRAAPLSLLFAALVLASFFAFRSGTKKTESALCAGAATGAAESVAESVGKLVDSGAALSSALEEDSSLAKSDIQGISEKILSSAACVTGVSTAPSAIVKYHFPEAGNESLVGHDLLTNPERRDALALAAELKGPVLSGPFESVDGGKVLFIRYPVYSRGSLWGFTSLTVDFGKMMDVFALGKRYPGFAFAISAGDADTFLAGDKRAFAQGIASPPLALPGTAWAIRAMPARGWSALNPYLFVLLAAGLTGAMFLFATLYAGAMRRSAGGATSAGANAVAISARNSNSFGESAAETVAGTMPLEDCAQAPAGGILAEEGSAPRTSSSTSSSESARGASFTDAAGETSVEPLAAPSPGTPAQTSAAAGSNEGANKGANTDLAAGAAAEASRQRGARDLKFLGPAVKGELYMPEVLISGDPDSLFAKFMAGQPELERADAARTTARTAAPDPSPRAAPGGESVAAKKTSPSNQKELLFTVEETSENPHPEILVVDDSEANREIMGRMLALRGYAADFARSGDEALTMCASRRYSIVFMDCFMPDMDGYKASASLRARFPDSGAKIVGMSARVGDRELERCRLAGMDDLLVKPFTLKQLLTHLEKR